MLKLKKKNKLFLDASCLIAATLSLTGDSFVLISKLDEYARTPHQSKLATGQTKDHFERKGRKLKYCI